MKQRLHVVMAWAHGYRMANPVNVVPFLLPQQPSKTVGPLIIPPCLGVDIPAFVATQCRGTQSDVSRRLLEFMILTACRSVEERWHDLGRNRLEACCLDHSG
ncbi:hypothetical protein [Jeongeupia sp. USM3]|uniref:hypothetical protein n=1 Tax=Jeongeupia sp. USM3 TaxID=1906741 RepID=UPI0011AB750E|nr:hypothetical protein [Jeongeupia sp. USM3]